MDVLSHKGYLIRANNTLKTTILITF